MQGASKAKIKVIRYNPMKKTIEVTPQELALLITGLDAVNWNENRDLARKAKALSDRLREAKDGAVLSMAS